MPKTIALSSRLEKIGKELLEISAALKEKENVDFTLIINTCLHPDCHREGMGDTPNSSDPTLP